MQIVDPVISNHFDMVMRDVRVYRFNELGCKDSNLGIAGPKPAALPLGDTPLVALV
jgi:hypothetical protein